MSSRPSSEGHSSRPTVSVIVLCYNRASLVVHALRSLGEQTCQAFEVVVVDDGSTDTSAEVIQELGKELFGERLRYVWQQNAGEGGARQAGILAASGDYVAWLDSDDVWLPWAMQAYLDAMREWPDACVIMGRAVRFSLALDAEQFRDLPVQMHAYAGVLAGLAEHPGYGIVYCVASRRSLVAAGFEVARVNCVDVDMMLRLSDQKGMVLMEGRPMFGYRQHEGGILANPRMLFDGTIGLVRAERVGRYPGGNAIARVRRQVICLFVRNAFVRLVAAGRLNLAWRLYLDTLGWQCRLGRLRFICAAPIVLMATLLRASNRHGSSV